jgi:hypothetical protein
MTPLLAGPVNPLGFPDQRGYTREIKRNQLKIKVKSSDILNYPDDAEVLAIKRIKFRREHGETAPNRIANDENSGRERAGHWDLLAFV